MKPCPHCQQPTPITSRFCQHCGRPLAPPDATEIASATVASRRTIEQQFDISALFGTKDRLLIGRSPDCDIYLPHPSVSRYHARVERRRDGIHLLPLPNINGVWLNGVRLHETTLLREGDQVIVGPYLLSITQGMLHSLDNSRGVRLEARKLEKEVPLPGGGTRKLLDGINLVVNPGEFVSLLGPSGSGKSTLMDCLNGRRRATGGQVIANGEDFYKHFDTFRQSLGYVPQKDIVHTQLTVRRALYYTARLRLPPDTDRDELEARVEEVIRQMELEPHRDTLVANLSGGQIKRVSLGAELLAEPSLLYIDEATSGLDAGTEARMMRLFRQLADEGRSVLCITHNVDNVERCHLILILARGKLIYYGPPAEAPDHFSVKRISDIYDRIAERDLAEWETRFAASPQYEQYVRSRLMNPTASTARSAEATPPASKATHEAIRFRLPAFLSESKLMEHVQPLADYFRKLEAGRVRKLLLQMLVTWNQFCVLTYREMELIRGDRRGLRLLLLQAPVVALFLLIGMVGKPFQEPMPLLRPLSDDERRTLLVMQSLGQLLDENRPLSPEQKKALAGIRVQVAGVPLTLDGNAVVRILRRLQSEDLPEAQKQALEEARFTLEVDGDPVTVSAAEVVRSWRAFQESKIPDQLLHLGGPVVPAGEGINPRYTYILLFVLVMIVLWFGCNNAAKEIVKETAIYARERAVNLHITPYLASKFLVLGVVTTLHALVLMAIVYGVLEALARFLPGYSVPAREHMLAYPAQFGVLTLLGLTGVALGLLLSACVSTPDRANALLPYVLIPQMILGGGFLAVTGGLLYLLAVTLSPVYWAYRAVHLGASELAKNFPGHAAHQDGILLPCVGLTVQMVVLLAATAVAMRQKDA